MCSAFLQVHEFGNRMGGLALRLRGSARSLTVNYIVPLFELGHQAGVSCGSFRRSASVTQSTAARTAAHGGRCL